VDGEFIDISSFLFTPIQNYPERINLSDGQQFEYLSFIEINGSRIEKKMTIYGSSYHVDIDLSISKSNQLLLNREYQIGWTNGLPTNEKNETEDFTYSESYASMAEELENFSIESDDPIDNKHLIGKTDWIAVRTKYFLSAIIPRSAVTSGVDFGGRGVNYGDVLHRKYNSFLNIEKTDSGTEQFVVYMGPLDHSILAQYECGLEDIVLSHGWYERTFRAISLPLVSLLKFLHTFIPNYGIVIIIFSVLVKIVVYPLTKKSYKSMKEMSRVQPLLTELREKYKGDPQRLNRETMKLYKEHGINPLGGCLPMLLQLPLLGALFIVFRSTIQLRGASFIPGWIDDLSSPDTLFHLPFSLPLYGDQFNILPILMAGSMIFQSKMTMQDPKQKAMVYIMPIFMLLIFNQFPSGLNLYYTLFNVLTIIQQKVIDDGSKPVPAKK
jgi:YidC/Oxa1 family membrane protein insertase